MKYMRMCHIGTILNMMIIQSTTKSRSIALGFSLSIIDTAKAAYAVGNKIMKINQRGDLSHVFCSHWH